MRYPVPGGYKYRNLALQVGEISILIQQNMVIESRGTQTQERLVGEAQQQLKATYPTTRQGGRPTSINL
jgi:hypothetical protein